MKNLIKKIINFLIFKKVNFLYMFNFGRYLIDVIQEKINLKKFHITYKLNNYEFFIPNRLNYWRATTLLTKEPETILWIENFDDNSIFWDIGANIGLYTCFAAKEKKSNVVAFEPSPFNLELLSKNVFFNNLSDKITILPISLNDKSKISQFNMTSIESGGAMSTFDKKYGDDGKNFNSTFNYKSLGVSGNDLIKKFNFTKPNYIKIDIDGIEHIVLEGMGEILDETKSILIEVNIKFKEKKAFIKKFLESQNFILKEQKQSDLIKNSKTHSNVFNQIWIKSK